MLPQARLLRYPAAAAVDPIKFFALGGVGGTADGGIIDFAWSLASLRADNIGTPAAVDGTLGMAYSLAHDTTPGANLTVNGDGSSTTGWTGATATASIVSGNLRCTSAGSANRVHQVHTTEIGATYRVRAKLTGNSNGAVLGVGTTNSGVTLLNLVYAPGVTNNAIEGYFIAQTTTSFLQVKAGATSGNTSDWDDLEVRKIPGRHWLQPTAAARPVIRQDPTFGFYYMENPDAARAIQGGLSFDVAAGAYLCAAMRRRESAGTTAYLSLGKSSTAYLRFGTSSNNRYSCTLRDAGTNTLALGITNDLPDARRAVIDSLVGSEVFDHTTGRRLPKSVAATGFVGNTGSTLVAYGSAAIGGINTGASVADLNRIFFMNQTPGADRAGIRSWAAAGMLAD